MADSELITRYLSGKEEILPYLINRYLKPIHSFVFGLVLNNSVADDITQDVFVKVWRNLKKYNMKYSFKTWIYSIARNTVIDNFRKRKDPVFSSFDTSEGDNIIVDTLADDTPLIEESLMISEEIDNLRNVLQELPLHYREILIMRYTDDLSIEEISNILKRPIETVKSQHRRGLLHLKSLLLRSK